MDNVQGLLHHVLQLLDALLHMTSHQLCSGGHTAAQWLSDHLVNTMWFQHGGRQGRFIYIAHVHTQRQLKCLIP